MWNTGRQANINRKPVVFDPVGVGATKYRRDSANGASVRYRRALVVLNGTSFPSSTHDGLASDCHQRKCGGTRRGCQLS